MVFESRTYSVLVVSSTAKGADCLTDMLPCNIFFPVTVVTDAGQARRNALESVYDIIIVNSPLSDEFGAELSIELSDSTDAGIMLLVRSENYEEVSAKADAFGVLTLAKPTTRQTAYQAIRLICATRERLRKLEKKNENLIEKMEEIRTVNRAKLLLIEKTKLTESDAHRMIEKQAMDMRISKRAAAERIIGELTMKNQ